MGKNTIKRKKQNDWAKKDQRTNISQEEYEKKNDEKSGWDIANIHIEYCTLNNLQKKSRCGKRRVKASKIFDLYKTEILFISTQSTNITNLYQNSWDLQNHIKHWEFKSLCGRRMFFRSENSFANLIWTYFFWKPNITFPFDI